MLIIFLNKVHFFYFCCIIHKDVGVKMYFAPSDTELLRALHSRNSKNIRNPLIFLQKMAPYSCFWRVPRALYPLHTRFRQSATGEQEQNNAQAM